MTSRPKNRPQARNRKLRLILRIFIVICAVGLAVSIAALIATNQEYAKGDAAYAQIRKLQTKRQQQGNEQDELLPGYGGVDFEALAQINPDVVAWLSEENGIIDYPVVKGADNDYYLRRLFTGERNKLGCLFMDYRNSSDFEDKNTVIYGHNMKDGSMFASLINYQQQSYYDSRPVMRLYTPKGDYLIEPFAGIVEDGSDEFIRFVFENSADFLAYIDELKADSTFKTDVEVDAQDRIVTLSTCSDDFTNARYALFGKLIRISEQ